MNPQTISTPQAADAGTASVIPIPNPLCEQPDFSVPAEMAAVLDELVTHYPRKRSASLMLLHAVEERYGYVSRQAVEWVAARLELAPINVHELVTFYPMFHRQPTGRFHLRICRTLSCALRDSYNLHGHFCHRLGLDPHAHGAQTTKDGMFTVEFVECLASCGTAPVIQCNGTFHEEVTLETADKILEGCK